MVRLANYTNVSLEHSLVAQIDFAVERGLATSRAALIRRAVHEYLDKVYPTIQSRLEEGAGIDHTFNRWSPP